MTFEEYKKQFEIFSTIDSPEKLAICESQYKMHLLHLEAQQHFEPFKMYSGDNALLRHYYDNLYTLLPFNNITENQLSLLIKPSFEPESLLVIDQFADRYGLTYTVLNRNYWYLLYEAFKGNKDTDLEKSVYTGNLRKVTGDKLMDLLDAAIAAAKEPDRGGFVLDGVVYILCRVIAGKKVTVFKHSPGEGSKTANILDILQYLIDHMAGLNDTMMAELDKRIDSCINDIH